MRALYLQNAQESFQSANEESIASWDDSGIHENAPNGEIRS